MTDREWAAATDPVLMWAFAESRMTARQRLLFAAGCCRRVWPLFTDFQLRNLVEIGEAVADGQANRDALEQALNELPERGFRSQLHEPPSLSEQHWEAVSRLEPGQAEPIARWFHRPSGNRYVGGLGIVNWHELPAWCRNVYFAARAVADFDGRRAVVETVAAAGDAAAEAFAEAHANHAKIRALRDRVAAEVSKLDDYRFRGMIAASEKKADEVRQLDAAVGDAVARLEGEIADAAREVRHRASAKERVAQAELLRCVAGHLHRPAPDIDPAWRTDIVVGIVRQMYDSREFGNMPVLADALEESGCDAPAVLTHCRHGTAHARGCWVIDAVRDWALTVRRG